MSDILIRLSKSNDIFQLFLNVEDGFLSVTIKADKSHLTVS